MTNFNRQSGEEDSMPDSNNNNKIPAARPSSAAQVSAREKPSFASAKDIPNDTRWTVHHHE